MFFLYTLLFYLALPVVFLRLFIRGRKNSLYRKRWAERLGFAPFCLPASLWLHAVSLGEAVAATPLIEALLQDDPKQIIVVTTMTPTGSTHVQKLAAKWPNNIYHSYVPYDLPSCVRRFMKRTKPTGLIVMETELWPTLFRMMAAQKKPVFVINARISDRAYPRYQRILALMPTILKPISILAAQSETDVKRFIHFGMDPAKTINIGNIKYDFELPPAIQKNAATLRATWPKRFVLIAASTHPGEESCLIKAYQDLKPSHSDLLLILVPRHPERFQVVADEIKAAGLQLKKRSENQLISPKTDVFLGDSMGELLLYYALSDLAFVGGSLVPIGGHNILEPAALGLPIIFGPYMNNSRKIADDFIYHHAAVEVQTETLLNTLERLINNEKERKALGDKAAYLLAENRGGLAKLLALIQAARCT